MAVYILSQKIENILNGIIYMQKYKEQMFGKTSAPIRYIFTEVPKKTKMDDYRKMGIDAEQLVNVYQYLANNHSLTCSVKTEDKLEELRNILHYTSENRLDSEIQLIKEGYVIATIILDRTNKEYLWGILYYSYTKLLRMEVYMDGIVYANSYVTAKSEHGIYAKLAKRTFYGKDGSVSYDQIFEGEKEWFLFSDGRIYTKPQMMEELIKKLKLSEEDIVFLDDSVPDRILRAAFMFGKAARLIALANVSNDSINGENNETIFPSGYYYDWFPYTEMLDTIVVSTEEQRMFLLEELEMYHCNIPNIKVAPINGIFTFVTLYESYGGNLALSWDFRGKADGFLIYDGFGTKVCETRNIHQHYFLIKGYEKKTKFILKAFIDTAKGKIMIAESEELYLCARNYEEPKVSLIIPAYNSEEYIVRAIDNALAQSFIDLEVIVVDDGSKDATGDIIDWYARKYINVVGVHQENAGASGARNMGIKHANGAYIGFMDSDDMIHPNMIEKLFNSARKNDCEISITSSYKITNEGYIEIMRYMMKEDVAMPVEKFFHEYYTPSDGLGVVVWNKLYKKSLIKDRLYPILAYEDEAWTPYILSYANKVCYLNDCLYELDRTVRVETLSDKLMHRSIIERFKDIQNIIVFYLTNGAPSKIGLLKELAKVRLKELEEHYAYEEYRKLGQWVDESF